MLKQCYADYNIHWTNYYSEIILPCTLTCMDTGTNPQIPYETDKKIIFEECKKNIQGCNKTDTVCINEYQQYDLKKFYYK